MSKVDNDRLYILGGLGCNPLKEISYYSIEKGRFQQVKAENTATFPRFNHSTVSYKGQLIVFGGEEMLPKPMIPPRILHNNIIIFNSGRLVLIFR